MNTLRTIGLAKLLTLAALALLPASQASAQSIGKVGAVNPDTTGTPPGGAVRTLVVGAGVQQKERIQTSAQGSAQILFSDSSTLNVGRNSSIVLDEYVYDPKSGTGSMLASMTRGVVRFVGGQISHTQGVTINTPVGSLGIRGGSGTIVFPLPASIAASDPGLSNCKGELVIGHIGTITIRNNAGQASVRPGFATCVSGPNDPIPEPFRISDAAMQKIVALLTSNPVQVGGVPNVQTEAYVIRSGIGQTIPDQPMNPPGSNPLGYSSVIDAGNSVVRSQSQTNQTNNAPPPPNYDRGGFTNFNNNTD